MTLPARRFDSLEQIVAAAAEAVRPPERLTIAEAAARYHYVNLPGTHVGPFDFSRTPYLVEPQNELGSLDFTGMVFTGPARTGKALAVSTPIATPTGWTTMGAIKVDDWVFGEDGRPCRVVATSQVMLDHDCYRIEFDDGSSIIADGGHLWATDDMKRGDSRFVLTTEEIAQTYQWEFTKGRRRPRYRIPLTSPIETPEVTLPVDPYFLGVWLGDGFSDRPTLTLNRDDADHICARLTQKGMRCYRKALADGRFADRVRVACGTNDREIWGRMRSIGLLGDAKHKHIPLLYLRASVEQRRELLRGLMDTDGSPGCGRSAAFANTLLALQEGVYELMASLGLKPFKNSFPNDLPGRVDTLCVSCTPPQPDDVFTLPRHIGRLVACLAPRREGQTKRRAIKRVDRIASEPVRCIRVDNDTHLFLAGEQMVPTHNSAMALNWLAYTAVCDPADAMYLNMTQATARDWSQGDLARMVRNSPEIARRMTPGRQNDNVFDKRFLSGMRLLIKWPTITELSGKTIPRLWLFDYDRMPQDVDGEGPPFDLARKRAQTFGRYGMCVAEASPGFPVQNAKWIPSTPHEAPPVGDEKGGGILQLYNRGDRRRWYWKCPHCGEPFEADFKHLQWPDSADLLEAAEQAQLHPPCCGAAIDHDQKYELNLGGKWIKDGQTWHADGSVTGTARRSDIASFWLKGPAAAFADWKLLVFRYLQAEEDYRNTGNEEALKTTINVDQGLPYTYKAIEAGRLPEDLKDRAEDWGGSIDAPVVPEGVRFLVKTIDVQARSFVVQTHGVTAEGDILIVEMKKLRRSVVPDDNGEWQPIDPAKRPEDWDVLIDEIEQLYPLADGSDRYMGLRIVGCDSGGAEGVTSNAYAFVRRLRAARSDLAERFLLLKGDGKPASPRFVISYPDAKRKDRLADARGEIPVGRVNANLVKDQASNMIDRSETGGQVRLPAWSPDWLWKQLTAEVRTAKGWQNLTRKRNEAWDLLVYCIALLLHRSISFERINWEDPPGFAREWDDNTLVVSGSKTVSPEKDDGDMDLAALAEQLA